MTLAIRQWRPDDLAPMIDIWNGVVEEGKAFPQEDFLTEESGRQFFASQSWCGVAEKGGKIVGLYIMHPNNVGRCGHICNASFAVKPDCQNLGIGEKLVLDCLCQAANYGFKIIQFNAVASSNLGARHLYQKLGFNELGVVPGGFKRKDGRYEDIHLFWKSL